MIRLPLLSLALLSAAALAYELLLMRLFSIIHWHHFAYMVIGLALLGHAFSGSVVTVLQTRLIKHFRVIYFAVIVMFSLFAMASFQWAQQIPFNAEEILWDWRQSLYLMCIFLLLSLPFFFVGAAICLSFLYFKRGVSSLYAADLLGAGLGCLGFVWLLTTAMPVEALVYLCCLGLLAAVVSALELRLPNRVLLAATLAFIGLLWQRDGLQLNISPYKSLPRTLLIGGARIVTEKSGPLGEITVLASDKIPFRFAPGMSLMSETEPLPQLAVFTDADNMSVITRKPDDLRQLAYLDRMSSALAYHLNAIEHALIIGSGGGNDVLQARYHRTPEIDAVELNPQIIELTGLKDGDFVSDVYKQADVRVHIADGRDFLNSRQQRFDLIQLTLLDSFNASAAGLYALNENYLYTVEALRLYLSRLQPGGYLSITRWVKMPPRDALKLFNTALDALGLQGNAGRRLLMIRSWQTATLIIKNGDFSRQEIENAETFCEQRNFDLVYTPAIRAGQANRFNVLEEPQFYRAVQALLSKDREGFVERYKFNLQPAIDDRPYFQHFFRWSSLPEMLGLMDKGGASLLESGYLVIFATLCVAIATSVVLILGPLLWLPKPAEPDNQLGVKQRDVFVYFFAIGLAFLMIEIAFMQKFILFLHHPVYAASAILTAFLVFAGFGSACSKFIGRWRGRRMAVSLAVIGIISISLLYLLILPGLFTYASGLPMTWRFILAITLIAPLAYCMGMPMPLALESLGEYRENLIPWAWGVNGCASVISSVLAALLAMQFGFSVVIIVAMVFYGIVTFAFPRPCVTGS